MYVAHTHAAALGLNNSGGDLQPCTTTPPALVAAAAAQVAIGIGQLAWAEQCFRLVIALDPHHGEALNNLGVLESKKGQLQQVCVGTVCGHSSVTITDGEIHTCVWALALT
jgi:hypothetical protein